MRHDYHDYNIICTLKFSIDINIQILELVIKHWIPYRAHKMTFLPQKY